MREAGVASRRGQPRRRRQLQRRVVEAQIELMRRLLPELLVLKQTAVELHLHRPPLAVSTWICRLRAT